MIRLLRRLLDKLAVGVCAVWITAASAVVLAAPGAHAGAAGDQGDNPSAHWSGGLKCGIGRNEALAFGTLTSGDGWVRISPANGNNFHLAWEGVHVLTRDQSMVTCTFRKGADMSDLYVPDTVTLYNGDAEMNVSIIVRSRSKKGGGSPATFDIGGTLHVSRNQAPGAYRGFIPLTLKHP